ncbi:hypothetical protein PR048_023465 [Dryococelus australis]|uniref:Uncharacterized protein n=1 Tax=Dryococelus australis TaxID=614101 RepID=A0ABQ9GU53_9NEOP|nr:hypothetical protein PR048_023465 [Dryococelus australis]
MFEEHLFAPAEITDRHMIQESSQNMPDKGIAEADRPIFSGELQECQSQYPSPSPNTNDGKHASVPSQAYNSASVSEFSNPFGILLIKKAKNSSEFIRSPKQQPNNEAARRNGVRDEDG